MKDDDLDARFEIWTSCADLSHARRVPSKAGHTVGWPVWSPDGMRIAFNADYDDPDLTDDTEIWDIYTMDRDGGNVRRLTESVGLAGDPGYSPDGSLIAFDSDETGKAGVWVMNAADGSDKQRVTPLPAEARTDYAPRFSPDGNWLVFTREVSDGQAALWIVNIDGSGLRRITPEEVHPEKADWSHDGTMIVFNATSGGAKYSDIWIVKPDGQGLTRLTTPSGDTAFAEGYSLPVWSPDDSRIMLVYGKHYPIGTFDLGLATMRPDGTDLRWVSDAHDVEKLPDWNAAGC